MLLWKYTRVPIRKTYTFDWWHGTTVPDEPDQRYVRMHYVLVNSKADGMGGFPMQPGKVRIFQKDGHGGEAFLGEDWGRFTPIDDKMQLYLGLARDVVVRRKVTQNERHPGKDLPYSRDVTLQYEIENFKTKPVTLDIREDMNLLRNALSGNKGYDAEWEIRPDGTTIGAGQVDRESARIAFFHVPLQPAPAGKGDVQKVVVTVHILFKNEYK